MFFYGEEVSNSCNRISDGERVMLRSANAVANAKRLNKYVIYCLEEVSISFSEKNCRNAYTVAGIYGLIPSQCSPA